MTKGEIKKRLNMNDSQLAELFGITRSAVFQWPDKDRLPLARELQLRYELRSDLFGSKAQTEEAA